MNKIEIARRCHICGASIRDHAFFCPQCGKPLDGSVADQSEADIEKVSPRSWADRPEHLESPTRILDEGRLTSKVKKSVPSKPRSPSQSNILDEADAINPQPLEKLRRVSSDVIEGASYDPSLRFLLVAAALFLVFLFLLLLSKLLG